MDSKQPTLFKMTQFCILQAKSSLQYCERHVLLFSAFCGEMLVQLFSVNRVGAMSYFLASSKMQDCSFPQFFLLTSNKNEQANQLIVLKSNKQNVNLEICWQFKS